jgi:hypothetical protein
MKLSTSGPVAMLALAAIPFGLVTSARADDASEIATPTTARVTVNDRGETLASAVLTAPVIRQDEQAFISRFQLAF